MNYQYPYGHPYGYPYGPMSHPTSSGYRFQAPPYGATMEPPSGSVITPQTPTGPNAPQYPGPPPFPGMASSGSNNAATYLTSITARGGGSYIDSLIRFNRGKIAHIHMTFNPGSGTESRVFTGRIETAGRDHIVLSDPQTGHRFILLMVYLDYIEFPEEINYYYPGTNVIKVNDESVLQDNPEILPLYYYNVAQREAAIKELEAATPNSPSQTPPPRPEAR